MPNKCNPSSPGKEQHCRRRAASLVGHKKNVDLENILD
jgi:hypothetical protein